MIIDETNFITLFTCVITQCDSLMCNYRKNIVPHLCTMNQNKFKERNHKENLDFTNPNRQFSAPDVPENMYSKMWSIFILTNELNL